MVVIVDDTQTPKPKRASSVIMMEQAHRLIAMAIPYLQEGHREVTGTPVADEVNALIDEAISLGVKAKAVVDALERGPD